MTGEAGDEVLAQRAAKASRSHAAAQPCRGFGVAQESAPQRDHATADEAGQAATTARQAGFFPVPLALIRPGMVADLPLYLRPPGERNFVLYRTSHVRFRTEDRRRLLEAGHQYVYITLAEQGRFRAQMETCLAALAGDTGTAQEERANLVYEAGLGLMEDVLGGLNLDEGMPRVENVGRAVGTLMLQSTGVFRHFAACAKHDLSTAADSVNVGVLMVALSCVMGEEKPDELAEVCAAGLLHNIGNLRLPGELLTYSGKLHGAQWDMIKRHPDLGYEHLSRHAKVSEKIRTAARQHHERLDGSGYPKGLRREEIAPISRVCAVADVFIAMTSFRPYRPKAHSAEDALEAIQADSPALYDAEVVAALASLVEATQSDTGTRREASTAERAVTRHPMRAPALLDELEASGSVTQQESRMTVVVKDISCTGIGLRASRPIVPGRRVRMTVQVTGWERRPLEGDVVRCRPAGGGLFEIGVRFTDADESGAGTSQAEPPAGASRHTPGAS